MAKDPAVLWYWNDWAGGTSTFSRHLKGCYIDLLHAQFNVGRLSLSEIKTVLGVDFSTWETLKKKFKQDENGNFYNERAEEEKQKRLDFSEKQRKNRLGKTKSTSQVKPFLENRNENENKDLIVECKINEILNSENWINEVALKNGSNSPATYILLVAFLQDQKLKDEIAHRELKEIKSHFINWLKIQLSKKTSANGKTTNFEHLTTAYKDVTD